MTDEQGLFIDRDIIAQIRSDAREARDGVLKLTAVMGEQNIPEKLTMMRSEMREQHRELRSDLVNAIDRSRTEFQEADKSLAKRVEEVGAGLSAGMDRISDRIKPLETDFERRTGGAMAFRLIKDWGAWVFAAGAALVAYVTSGGKLP